MNADIILKKKEDAVSPVIGVMLMLVVTIVIAAVVAAFAGGLATETESAPVVVLDADVYANGNNAATLTLRSLSGDNLDAADVSIKIQDLEGKTLATGKLTVSGYLSPGMTDTITLSETGTIGVGDYVEVVVLYDGKHIVLSKEVLVKA
ncbi:MAG: type IV pilin N-terminal domain-containing protein [Methanocorpusculum sp.]|nr:type IV pilin N-terminal domain-containing protein [Methanocorpusculum sp.]